MAVSQNVAFAGTAPAHEDDSWAPGHGLMIELRDKLMASGWEVSEPDVWRGSGWSLTCRAGGEELSISLAAATPPEWMLQAAPAYVPGLVGKLRGKAPSASPESCYSLARAIDAALTAGGFTSLRWCWDDDPWRAVTTDHPSPDGQAGAVKR